MQANRGPTEVFFISGRAPHTVRGGCSGRAPHTVFGGWQRRQAWSGMRALSKPAAHDRPALHTRCKLPSAWDLLKVQSTDLVHSCVQAAPRHRWPAWCSRAARAGSRRCSSGARRWRSRCRGRWRTPRARTRAPTSSSTLPAWCAALFGRRYNLNPTQHSICTQSGLLQALPGAALELPASAYVAKEVACVVPPGQHLRRPVAL